MRSGANCFSLSHPLYRTRIQQVEPQPRTGDFSLNLQGYLSLEINGGQRFTSLYPAFVDYRSFWYCPHPLICGRRHVLHRNCSLLYDLGNSILSESFIICVVSWVEYIYCRYWVLKLSALPSRFLHAFHCGTACITGQYHKQWNLRWIRKIWVQFGLVLW